MYVQWGDATLAGVIHSLSHNPIGSQADMGPK